jgi:hypothetical protein
MQRMNIRGNQKGIHILDVNHLDAETVNSFKLHLSAERSLDLNKYIIN